MNGSLSVSLPCSFCLLPILQQIDGDWRDCAWSEWGLKWSGSGDGVGGGGWNRASRHYSEGARSKTDLSAKAHLFCGCCFRQRS